MELHAWKVPRGELRQLTDRPAGTLFGFISADGRHVYYLDDESGNEAGHLVRVPWEGGAPEDVTPTFPPYSSLGGATSRASNLFAFTTIDADGYGLVAVDLDATGGLGEPRLLHRDKRLFTPPVVSPTGEVVVVASTERTRRRGCRSVVRRHPSAAGDRHRPGERTTDADTAAGGRDAG
ncbi:MAG: hypothetical protein QOF01_3516 [Thermomicrobiales bacterium]|jgi:hypothetical protein|nr:hypothetical protein [Thermomicrobiales bacterium]